MAGDEFSTEESLASELKALRPTILRQQRAEHLQPDRAFAQALRDRLVGTPERVPVAERLRRIVAVLLPPQPRLSLQGVRGGGGTPQPVTYTAEDAQVTLSFETDSAVVIVRGMIFGADLAAGTSAALLGTDDAATTAGTVDEFGAFTLRAPAGTYTLRVSLLDREIDIVDLTLNI